MNFLHTEEEYKLLKEFMNNPVEMKDKLIVYTVLTTYPPHRSRNVGDMLITSSCMDLIKNQYIGENKPILFYVLFRETPLDGLVNIINNTQAIILAGFPILEDMCPRIFKFTEDLNDINVPFIPIGCGQNFGHGVLRELVNTNYTTEDYALINYINENSPCGIGTRDPIAEVQLAHNSIDVYGTTGDCALYDLSKLFTPLQYTEIKSVVFTQPHSPLYTEQSVHVIDTINKLFPNATKYCAYHGTNNSKNPYASEAGFKEINCHGDLDSIKFYEQCDLHIGYRLHGHISFLRNRRPSVLLVEDARGVAFAENFKRISFFNAFDVVDGEKVPVANVGGRIEKFVAQCLANNFDAFNTILNKIDNMYTKVMDPYITKTVNVIKKINSQ